VAAGSEASETFKIMERRLMQAIMRPAMLATWIFGGTMVALNSALLHQGWLIVKIVMVIIMTGLHHAMIGWRKAFAEDRNRRPAKFFRIANEIPTLLLIIIVIMVIVRPF
jgi:putative membrane protein